ncbi:MAG: hypothetical protein HY046_10030 [Acidobacteria bacterium]|nr:hypothetical protein [Acidobacteriota bacterium]
MVVKRDYLRLNFLCEKSLEDRNILWTQKLTSHRAKYGLALTSSKEITPRVLAWLKAAYRLQSK